MEDNLIEHIEALYARLNFKLLPVQDDLVSEALNNQNIRLPQEKYEEYRLILARYSLWLQSEINKRKALVSLIDQKIFELTLGKLAEGFMSHGEKVKIAAMRSPTGKELLRKKESLGRELTTLSFLTNGIDKIVTAYADIARRCRDGN